MGVRGQKSSAFTAEVHSLHCFNSMMSLSVVLRDVGIGGVVLAGARVGVGAGVRVGVSAGAGAGVGSIGHA